MCSLVCVRASVASLTHGLSRQRGDVPSAACADLEAVKAELARAKDHANQFANLFVEMALAYAEGTRHLEAPVLQPPRNKPRADTPMSMSPASLQDTPPGVEVELQAATVDQQGCSWWTYEDVAHDPDRKCQVGKWPGPWPAWLPTDWKVGFDPKYKRRGDRSKVFQTQWGKVIRNHHGARQCGKHSCVLRGHKPESHR